MTSQLTNHSPVQTPTQVSPPSVWNPITMRSLVGSGAMVAHSTRPVASSGQVGAASVISASQASPFHWRKKAAEVPLA